ncbi:MAG: aspartate--tRNA ligase [Oscillospiraceae bacterium]
MPQAPQQFKQLLMTSGFDRYFRIAPCFRDEDARGDRSPGEFYQLDMEMAFATQEDVFTVLEDVLPPIFAKYGTYDIASKAPFTRIPYLEAMEKYGSDKPDLRIDLVVQDITALVQGTEFAPFAPGNVIKAVAVSGCEMTRKQIDKLCADVEVQAGNKPYWFKVEENGEFVGGISKFLNDRRDSITEALGRSRVISSPSRQGRRTPHRRPQASCARCSARLDVIEKGVYKFLWVTEFPMFEYSEEDNRYVAMHHPFTAPMDEDVELLETDKTKCRAKAYDIVLNGCELGGGSIRINTPEMQETMFRALGFSKEAAEEQFGHLIHAFQFGAPPHGGLAYGLDRLVMLMSGADSIRDVIAFPKVQNASDLMMSCPDVVDPKQLDELSIAITQQEEENE